MSKDHDKLHQHDENCNCELHEDQNHEHHHKHKAITVSSHDMSIVGSYQFNIDKPFSETETIIDDLLKSIARDVTNLGGIIGHIKASLTSQDKSCIISITEDESNKRYIESSICNIEGVAIVFFIEPEQLEGILMSTFREYVKES